MKRGVTFWSEAGGVGKTTLAVNTSAALSRRGNDVLVIDLDPQDASLTDHVGFDHLTDDEDYYGEALLDPQNVDISDYIVDAGDFDLLPSNEQLANLERHLKDAKHIRIEPFQLQNALVPIIDEYDYIICDPQASLSTLVDNAIVATRNFVVPVELTRKGVVSMGGLEEVVRDMKAGLSPHIEGEFDLGILALIPNETNDQKRLDREKRDELADKPVAPFSIGERSVLQYAWDEQQTLFEYAEENELRDYEKDTLAIFDRMAEVVERGSVDVPAINEEEPIASVEVN